MKVHHLNCGTMCPRPRRLVNGEGLLGRGRMVCHCLLVETKDGLVLVDTGLALRDVEAGGGRLGLGFALAASPARTPDETAIRHVERLGFTAKDVRHIVPTHLDLDHVSGLVDFPEAKVHVLDREHEAAMARPSFRERRRYVPELFAHSPRWEIHAQKNEKWLGFDAVPVAEDVLLVPLFGHTRGHCAVAVRGEEGKWLLHAGDAYFFHLEVHAPERRCPLGLRLFQWLVEIDRAARLSNQDRLRALARERPEVTVFSAHCPVELERLAKT